MNVGVTIKPGQKPDATILATIDGKPVFFAIPLTFARQAVGGSFDHYIGSLAQPTCLPPNTNLTLSIDRAESDTYQLQGAFTFTTINLD